MREMQTEHEGYAFGRNRVGLSPLLAEHPAVQCDLLVCRVSNTSMAAPTTYNYATYTGVNLIWNPYGSVNVGAEFL